VSKVHLAECAGDLEDALQRLFLPFGGVRKILDGREDVFLKINAVDFKPHCHTPADLVEALVTSFYRAGAGRVYVMDNCTQGNFTRLVFHATGIFQAVRRAGGTSLYLDEGPEETLSLREGSGKVLGREQRYEKEEIALPRLIVERLIRRRDLAAYINVPKCKTHCMTTVTLGIKNQWGFVAQKDRIEDHNHRLHRKFVDILQWIRPDFTLIDAREAIQYGHYPSRTLMEHQRVPLGLLVGGDDVVSVDAAGCALMGFAWQDVEHVRLAHERGLGNANLEEVEIIGELGRHARSLSWELLPVFPGDVDVHRGEEMCCREGCASNVMACLQVFSLDFAGRGGFSVVMGKGWEPRRLERLQSRVLVVGTCAADEVGDRLKAIVGPESVAVSYGCNNLTETITALLRWMRISPLRLIPVSPLQSVKLLTQARWHGSKARIPPLWIR